MTLEFEFSFPYKKKRNQLSDNYLIVEVEWAPNKLLFAIITNLWTVRHKIVKKNPNKIILIVNNKRVRDVICVSGPKVNV